MSGKARPHPDRATAQSALLMRLLPPGAPASAEEIVEGYAVRERVAPPARPYVLLNMVSTVDGRASIGGRSGSLGNRADHELFHGLREAVDAVLVGAGTVRSERYGRIVPDELRRRRRLARGVREEPLACVVSASLTLPVDVPLLADPAAHVVILTPSQASLPSSAATVDYVRVGRDGRLDLPAALHELRERFQVATLLCEGGPHLNRELLAAGLIDELFLSVSPILAGGSGDQLRIVAGPELKPPASLQLLSVVASESELFLRYGV